MFKTDYFFFKLFVLLSLFHRLVFTTSIGNFRLLHFCIPIMFVIILRHTKKTVGMKKYRKIFSILFLALCYGGLTYFSSKYQNGTVRIFFSMALNLTVFYFFIFFLETYKSKLSQILIYLKKLVELLSILTILQWFGALAHIVPISQPGEGILGVGRPGLFFGDPNWLGYFLLFMYAMVDTGRISCGLKIGGMYRILVFVALLFMQSRVMLMCFFLHYFYCVLNYKNKWILIPFVLFFFISFIDKEILLQILPERFVYDIMDSDNNPRLIDVENISEEVKHSHRQIWGMGWGSLGYIADIYPYRNYDITINVWPGQIYYDFGYVGLYAFLMLTIVTFICIKSYHFKFLFAFFLLNCSFHMPGYYLYSWVLLGIGTYLYYNNKQLELLKR